MAPDPTISAAQILEDFCPHCEARTVQVIGGTGLTNANPEGEPHARGCLQCIADGGTCCSIQSLNRHSTP
jgi:hypothetical protein